MFLRWKGLMQREMPTLRPFLAEYGGIVRRNVPSKSIVDIPKFSEEDKEIIMELLELWNRAVIANGWSIDVEMVMSPLYLFGRALQYFRTLPTEVKGNAYEKSWNLNSTPTPRRNVCRLRIY